MAANIEFKARLKDVNSAKDIARRICGCTPTVISQADTFFRCDHGRFKLRIIDGSRGELIAYERSDENRPRRSTYEVFKTEVPLDLESVLQRALNTIGCVKKRRSVYTIGQIRIHVDEVENLGDFLEIEVGLADGQPDADGEKVTAALLREFGISPTDIVGVAYLDLLLAGS